MGCTGSKKKAPRPCEGQAAETGTSQSAAAQYETAESLGSIDFAARSLRVCFEEAGVSDNNTPTTQRYDRQHLAHGVLGLSIPEVSLFPSHLGSIAATRGGDTPRTPLAAPFLGPVTLAASAPPQLAQLTSSRRGVTEGLDTMRASGTWRPRNCDEASRGEPLPGHMLPHEAPPSALAAVYLDSLSRSPLCSLGPVVGTCDSVDHLSATFPHSAGNTYAEASRELRSGVESSEGGPLLTGSLGDTSTMGASILQTVRSRQPPSPQASRSLRCPPVTPPAAQQLKPSVLLVPLSASAIAMETAASPSEPPRATQAPSPCTTEAHHDLQLESTEGFSGGVGHGDRRRLFSLSPLVIPSPHAEGIALEASVPMNATAGTSMRCCFESGGDADAFFSGGASDGREEGTSEGSPKTKSTQLSSAMPSAGQFSVSASSLLSIPQPQQPQLSVVQMLHLRPSHDSASPPGRIPAEQPIAPLTPSPSTTGPVNAIVSACSDALDDVSLPRHSGLLSPRQAHNAGGDGTVGARTPLLPMRSSALQHSVVIHANSESLLNASSVSVTSGTATLTQPRTSRWERSSSNAHHLATGSNSWLLSSVNNTDGGSSGLVGGSRWNNGSFPSTPLPTNSELVRQIRQPTTRVKSILRKPGSANTISNGATAVNNGDETSASHFRVVSLSVNAGSVERKALSPPRMLVSSGTAVSGDKRASVTCASLTEPALPIDFVVLHRSSSDMDGVNSGAPLDDGSPLSFGTRSATYYISPRGAYLRPKLFNTDSATSSNASGVVRASIRNGSSFAVDAVYSSVSANTDGTSPGAKANRSCEFPRWLPQSLSTSRLISPHAGQQRRWRRMGSDDSAKFGNVSHGEIQAPLPQLTGMESSTPLIPDAVAPAGLTSDEPPPDIMLASPPPKRVHMIV